MGAELSSRHVLVVEDEYFIANDIAEALRQAGADIVGPAPDAQEAFRLLDAEPVDFAILDINLRGGTTFAVADRLARDEIPFVFATGYDRSIIPKRHQGIRIWEKPFDAAALVRDVSRLG
jgi:CheY-like chemotaxis protein